ncbi:response regulator [Verrucomicrobiales bacterium BCK34]|nr:response regulator [Verrucomicrobiales bacterium BCK34]
MRIVTEYLPDVTVGALDSSPQNNPTPGEPPNLETSRCTILVIDDDAGLQRLIQQILAPGARILQELDGITDYVDRLDFEGVDAVVLDYKMPGQDGLTVLKRIREKYSDLPILFMTGFGDLDVARQAISAGANEYFPKPFNAEDLRQVVSKWVPSFRLDAENNKIPSFLTGGSSIAPANETENFLTATDALGNDFRSRVIRYNSRAVVVETPADSTLAVGSRLKDTIVTLGNRSIEMVGPVVQKVTELSGRNLIEIGLPGTWQIEGFDENTAPEEITRIVRSREKQDSPVFSRFSQGLHDRQTIPESYRTTVSDVEHILQELYDDLEPFEKFLIQVDPEDRSRMEGRMVEYAEGRFFPALTAAMDKFERAAEAAARDGIKSEFRKFAQKRLFPLMLCSPFLCRVIEQPIGVPGDYGVLGQILGHPYEGHTLFGRMLNAWVLTSHPAKAYRHRIDLLSKSIDDAVTASKSRNEKTNILSMGSGVAFEVQRYVTEKKGNEEIDFELVDFSTRTLQEAERRFINAQKISTLDHVNVMLKQSSVVELINGTRGGASTSEQSGGLEQKYDLVYCAGLYDYLSDRLCRSVTDYLYSLTKPGGKVLVSNYAPPNPLKNFMEYILDWELIHRSVDDFHTIMKKTGAKDSYHIETDATGTELYAIAQR